MKYETIWNPLASTLKKYIGRDVSVKLRNGSETCGQLIRITEDLYECSKTPFRHYDVKTIKIFPVAKVTKVRRTTK